MGEGRPSGFVSLKNFLATPLRLNDNHKTKNNTRARIVTQLFLQHHFTRLSYAYTPYGRLMSLLNSSDEPAQNALIRETIYSKFTLNL